VFAIVDRGVARRLDVLTRNIVEAGRQTDCPVWSDLVTSPQRQAISLEQQAAEPSSG
jgi:hypothetical protein